MSRHHVLLDSLELLRDQSDVNSSYPLSEYINESEDLQKSPSLNNNPSLLKFIISEKKDFIEVINENKFRGIKDNVTDAFVNEFFIGNYEVLNMLLDYQYHLIYFDIMSKINDQLMPAEDMRQSNRMQEKLERENMYPLQDNEHILLNFKGGSTMYYLYNNIINHLAQAGVNREQFNNINQYFKISDIDLALNIETGNSYRYFQLESIVSYLLTETLEDLTNRLEFMYLTKICSNLVDNIDDIDITTKIQEIMASLNLLQTLDHINVIVPENTSRVYEDDIYNMKLEINRLKTLLISQVNMANVTEANNFISRFIEYDADNKKFIVKSVDMLEISLLSEFVSYMSHINSSFDPTILAGILNIKMVLKNYGKHLLNVKYKYLLNNLYDTNHLNGFINRIQTGLRGVNNTSLLNAKNAYLREHPANGPATPRQRLCNTDLIVEADGSRYFQDYRYLTETKSEIKSIYNLVSDNDAIIKDNITFEGRENFFLRPQDSSKYPYLFVTTKNCGSFSDSIKDLKKIILHKNGVGPGGRGKDVLVNLIPTETKKLNFENNMNIHYLSINKSIFIENNRFITTFNLFRIKFNVVLKDLIEKIDVINGDCNATIKSLTNAPSEFLDVGIGSKDDTFHSIADEIEEHNNGIIFNITYSPEIVPAIYGTKSRILSYHIKTFAADLNNVLYCQQKIPWLDLKYQKRLFRLLFYIFNVLNNEHLLPQQPVPPNQHVNIVIREVFINFFNNIDYNLITYENIVTNPIPNDFTIENRLINEMIRLFIQQISIDGTDIFITDQTIKDLILSGRELHNHLLLKPKYKIADGFFSYTIIYILLIKKLKDEITADGANIEVIIAEYSKLIQIFYDRSGISFNINNYGDENQMNQSIVKGFIEAFKLYINNIIDAIRTLEIMFNAGFDYNMYPILPINANP